MTFFDIDTGSSGSAGPFLSWQAKESNDGAIPGRNFVLREQGERTVVTDAFKAGVIFDITTLKTGWCYSTGAAGQAPQWKWNASISRYEPSPGDGWKKGLSIRIALNKDTAATLEQSSAAIMSMLGDLGSYLRQSDAQAQLAAGKLPVVKLVGTEKVDSRMGTTFVPKIEVVKWADRPAVLGDGGMAIDTGDAAPAPAVKPAAAAKKVQVDDEPF